MWDAGFNEFVATMQVFHGFWGIALGPEVKFSFIFSKDNVETISHAHKKIWSFFYLKVCNFTSFWTIIIAIDNTQKA